jgi:hypothetical protein
VTKTKSDDKVEIRLAGATATEAKTGSRSEVQPGDGSLKYRVGAMLAMILLAIASLVVWFSFRNR